MWKHRSSWVALMAIVEAIGVTMPSHAITGTVRITVAKAGFVVGAGGGRGTLSFRHRLYPFTVQGLGPGLQSDTGHEHRRDQAGDGRDRSLRPHRSWLLPDFPGKGVFTRPRPVSDLAIAGHQPTFLIYTIQFPRAWACVLSSEHVERRQAAILAADVASCN
jgi:hypothetical protein